MKRTLATILFFLTLAIIPAQAKPRWSYAPREFGRSVKVMVTFHEDGHRAIAHALVNWASVGAAIADARTSATSQRIPGVTESDPLLGKHPSRLYLDTFLIGDSLLWITGEQMAHDRFHKPWTLLLTADPIVEHTVFAWRNSNIKPLPIAVIQISPAAANQQ